MIAAPSPCSARAATSIQSEVASPQSTEATVNRQSPPSSNRRRPVRSPSRPTLTINVVLASRYASTTHCTSGKTASNSFTRVGRATLAMLVPSDARSRDSARLASAQRCFMTSSGQ